MDPRMIEAAVRVTDGLLGHTLFSPSHIEEVGRPALVKGAQHAGRDPADVALATYTLAVASHDEEQARREAAVLGSVKSYGLLFETCGFAAAARAVQQAFAARDVEAMVGAVTDAIVDEFAVAGTPAQVIEALRRYDGVADHVVLSPPSFRVSPERIAENLALLSIALRRTGTRMPVAWKSMYRRDGGRWHG